MGSGRDGRRRSSTKGGCMWGGGSSGAQAAGPRRRRRPPPRAPASVTARRAATVLSWRIGLSVVYCISPSMSVNSCRIESCGRSADGTRGSQRRPGWFRAVPCDWPAGRPGGTEMAVMGGRRCEGSSLHSVRASKARQPPRGLSNTVTEQQACGAAPAPGAGPPGAPGAPRGRSHRRRRRPPRRSRRRCCRSSACR